MRFIEPLVLGVHIRAFRAVCFSGLLLEDRRLSLDRMNVSGKPTCYLPWSQSNGNGQENFKRYMGS